MEYDALFSIDSKRSEFEYMPSRLIARAVDYARNYYTYQWWGHTNCDSNFQFFATGNLGQTIYMIPDEDMIIVLCGNSLEYYNEDVLWHMADLIKSGAYR